MTKLITEAERHCGPNRNQMLGEWGISIPYIQAPIDLSWYVFCYRSDKLCYVLGDNALRCRMSRTCIAVINDDRAIVDMLTDFLQDAGYETIECFAGEGAYDLIRREHPALVIIDLQMEHPEAGLHVLQ